MDMETNDQTDDEIRDIEERRAMEAAGEIPQPPSPRPSTPAPRKGITCLLYHGLLMKSYSCGSLYSFAMDTESTAKRRRPVP